ncbi:MAG: hypothetical protein ACI835_004321 [Planctomycetota bacterium]|jgi:hypothetical protein
MVVSMNREDGPSNKLGEVKLPGEHFAEPVVDRPVKLGTVLGCATTGLAEY